LAPRIVHDVEQVVIVPFPQVMQTSTHWFMFFGV
jgi:hypothetical protein